MPEVMRAVDDAWEETPFDLVLPLRARFEACVAFGDRTLDQLVVAELEVKHLERLGRTPIATVEIPPLLEGETSGHGTPLGIGERSDDAMRRRAAQDFEERR